MSAHLSPIFSKAEALPETRRASRSVLARSREVFFMPPRDLARSSNHSVALVNVYFCSCQWHRSCRTRTHRRNTKPCAVASESRTCRTDHRGRCRPPLRSLRKDRYNANFTFLEHYSAPSALAMISALACSIWRSTSRRVSISLYHLLRRDSASRVTMRLSMAAM